MTNGETRRAETSASARRGTRFASSGRTFSRLLLLVLVWLGYVGCEHREPPLRSTAVKECLKARHGVYQEELDRFYAEREHQPAWTDDFDINQRGRDLLDELYAADQEGLDSTAYGLVALERSIRTTYLGDREVRSFTRHVAELDIALSEAFFRYAHDLAKGRVPPGGAYLLERTGDRGLDLVSRIKEALGRGVAATLQDIASRHHGYRDLRDALARYRNLQAEGGWSAVPDGDKLVKGSSGPRVVALRRRLAITGDLQGPADDPLYDQAVVEAVMHFQRRNGLPIDGVAGEGTLAVLNLPVEARIGQIEINLERRRWLAETLGQEYVLVNIPELWLEGRRGGELRLEMPVIVGAPSRPTPLFADEMSSVVFHPYWNVPASIAVDEILPKAQADPRYLTRNDYEVVGSEGEPMEASSLREEDLRNETIRIRQKPGPKNSLGKVKFLFPNQFDVYFHDTPAGALFQQPERDLSHGCIRVERPGDLAELVLEGQWSRQQIEEALAAGEEQHVALEKPVPVYLLYHTAWAEEDGTVQFREDIYGLDRQLWNALHPRCSLPPLP